MTSRERRLRWLATLGACALGIIAMPHGPWWREVTCFVALIAYVHLFNWATER